MAERTWTLPDETATAALAARVAAVLADGLVVYLRGELGAGKTSFARALLGALGVGERIKSPTYSLVEGYRAGEKAAWHLDLYRIADPGELEWLGLDELADPTAIVLVEWPERGRDALPKPDLEVDLFYDLPGRKAVLRALTGKGQCALEALR